MPKQLIMLLSNRIIPVLMRRRTCFQLSTSECTAMQVLNFLCRMKTPLVLLGKYRYMPTCICAQNNSVLSVYSRHHVATHVAIQRRHQYIWAATTVSHLPYHLSSPDVCVVDRFQKSALSNEPMKSSFYFQLRTLPMECNNPTKTMSIALISGSFLQ